MRMSVFCFWVIISCLPFALRIAFLKDTTGQKRTWNRYFCFGPTSLDDGLRVGSGAVEFYAPSGFTPFPALCRAVGPNVCCGLLTPANINHPQQTDFIRD